MVKFSRTKLLAQYFVLGLSFGLPSITHAYQVDEKLSVQLQKRLAVSSVDQKITLFVYFKDKGENLADKLLQAKESLTPQALQRRTTNLGIDNVVSFNDIPIESSYIELIKSHVVKVRHQLRNINAISVEAKPEEIENILSYAFVRRIDLVQQLKRESQSKNIVLKSSGHVFDKQLMSNMELDYGSSFTQNNLINIPAVHNLGYDGSGVSIALFDAGFNRLTHEAFTQMTIAGAWDFVNNDGDVGDGADMGVGSHGTNTLSAIGGYSPTNLIGPAFAANYYLAKTENTESELHVEEDNWCAAAEWADENGVQIISSSLGYTVFDSGTDYNSSDMNGDTTVITRCADLVAENGIVVINSIGNSGSSRSSLGAPSDGDFVLAVGAVQSSGAVATFSSVGPSADGRIKPDISAMGAGVTVASSISDTGYVLADGTSFACPLTAGVAALILEANNNLTAAQVRDILRSTSAQALTPDNSSGYGIVDALAAVEFANQAMNGSLPPSASYAVTTDGLSASFSNISTDTDGSIDSYQWDFGDSSTSNLENVNHTYSTGGTYNVSLTVTDNNTLVDTVTRVVTVTSPPVAAPPPAENTSSGGGSIGILLIGGFLGLIFRRKFILTSNCD